MSTKYTIEIGGRDLSFEVGKMAGQANGAVLVRYGEGAVLVTAVMSDRPREGVDFLPLTCDYLEMAYAAGRIPGGFFRREIGRPSEKETLTSRLIDRPLRPLFPPGISHDIQIIATVLSGDLEVDSDIPALCGAAAALEISDIPFNGPVAAVRVAKLGQEFILNPTNAQIKESRLSFIVAGAPQGLVMVEGDARMAREEEVLEALFYAQERLQPLLALIKQMGQEVGRPMKVLGELQKKIVRDLVLKEKRRLDGRGFADIRPVSCEINLLSRTHGSALFTRGETQALAVATLGTPSDEQRIESLFGETFKSFMLHYNFPPYSVGETRFLRGPGRREIGHGVLAERAIAPVLPPAEEFPYTIRVVSEILSSNGSSSMATVCGASLALMDAGVPIKAPVAGVAMGLIKEGEEVAVLTDILGDEDALGDMDFKVAGTEEGITALQMDIKMTGLTPEIMAQALNQAREARLYILEKMNQTIDRPSPGLKDHAPKIVIIQINPLAADEAIRMIRELTEEAEVGRVYQGKVKKIMDFGAFVEILPHTDGLLHISELAHHRVKAVTDILKEGDEVTVKVLEIDPQGKRHHHHRVPKKRTS